MARNANHEAHVVNFTSAERIPKERKFHVSAQNVIASLKQFTRSTIIPVNLHDKSIQSDTMKLLNIRNEKISLSTASVEFTSRGIIYEIIKISWEIYSSPRDVTLLNLESPEVLSRANIGIYLQLS